MYPQIAQMNHAEYAALKMVNPMGISMPHVFFRTTRMSVDVHLGQIPVFFNETS